MTRVTARRLCIAILAALHFVAAPCVMAMGTGGDEPCGHCDTSVTGTACANAANPADVDGAPGPGRDPVPDGFRSVAFLVPRLAVASPGGLQRTASAQGIGLSTGRHAGDPQLHLVFARFLN